MSYNRILITGINGYVAKIFDAVLLNTEHVVTTTELRGTELEEYLYENGKNIDILIHCGMPSSNDTYTDQELHSGIILQTYRLAHICKREKIYLIFPSSHIVDYGNGEINNNYKQCHIEASRLISRTGSNGGLNFCIIKLPRIYSSERKKGLINSLRENKVPESDMDKAISYTDKEDIYDWLGDFFESFKLDNRLFDHMIQKIPTMSFDTLAEIKARYIND